MARKTALAILLSIASATFLTLYVQQQKQVSKVDLNLVPIVVATRDIPENTLIDPKMITTKEIPMRYAIDRALSQLNTVRGKVTTTAIQKGDQISNTKIMDKDNKNSNYLNIPQGMRAITITPDDSESALELIGSGDKVDVIINYEDDTGQKTATFDDVKIIHMSEVKLDASSPSMYSLTILLDREKAESITKADQYGTIRIVHRPKDELDINKPHKIATFGELGQSTGVMSKKATVIPIMKHSNQNRRTAVQPYKIIKKPPIKTLETIEVIRGFETETITLVP